VTTKRDFTVDEWSRIVRAPLVAGMAVALADPGSAVETAKETLAALETARNAPSPQELLTEVASEVRAMTQRNESPLGGYRPAPDGGPAGDQVLAELRAVQAVVAGKASPGEVTAFARWLVAAAEAAAQAAKEGGFLGIGGQQVSDREKAMLDRVREAVSG
jgi:hypothetical protein